jgi:uncharacterized protein YprB with RNaseH-like and TPR domain
MTKKELTDRFDFKCRHFKNGLEHPACYERDHSDSMRVGCLDIEASGLKANFNFVLSWCIKELGGDIKGDVIAGEDIRAGVFDKRIVQSCIEELRKYNKILTHYGTNFDIKFLRTRALVHRLDFPQYGEILHTDVYYMAKRILLLHSNRQDCVTEALYGRSHKTRIHPDIWMQVTRGNLKALKYLYKHNMIDVKELEKNYLKLKPFSRETKKSI